VVMFNITFNQQYFSYIVAVSFIGGGNRSIRGKPPTHFITEGCIEYTSPYLNCNFVLIIRSYFVKAIYSKELILNKINIANYSWQFLDSFLKLDLKRAFTAIETIFFPYRHGEVYSIQPSVIKCVGGFPRILRFPPPIKLTATINTRRTDQLRNGTPYHEVKGTSQSKEIKIDDKG
jgi:hypothetical protein